MMAIKGKNLTVTLHGKEICCVPFKRSEIDVTNDDCDGWQSLLGVKGKVDVKLVDSSESCGAVKKFPNFDFKIDCGDDPRVRQWLHDNGCLIGIYDPTAYRADQPLMSCRAKSLSIILEKSHFNAVQMPLINPYEFMQPEQKEPTVAERIAEENRLWWEQHDSAVTQAQERALMRATIKPDLTVAPGRNDEMVERDEREPTLKEKYVMWKVDQADIKPIPSQLTIPSICLADQAMPMMLGGEFGGRHE